jgi:hypothetical protein
MIPKVDLPIYELTLPSNGKKIRIRPFIVKEEKLLLMAVESNDEKTIIDTTKQILNNCVIDGQDFNIDKLPFFDIDYLFISLRAKSIGESVDINYTCNNITGSGNRCGNTFPAKIDVSNCSVIKDDTISKDIQLSSKMLVKMKYPNYTTMKLILENDNIINKKINIIAGSIEMIQDGDNVYTSKDFTKQELVEFIENLTQEQYRRLEYFVDNFPSFVITSQATCDACGYTHKLEYKDFASFFV